MPDPQLLALIFATVAMACVVSQVALVACFHSREKPQPQAVILIRTVLLLVATISWIVVAFSA